MSLHNAFQPIRNAAVSMSSFSDFIPKLYNLYRQHPHIETDSRKVKPGCIFFALKGERFNGNEFARQALENGAVCAVIDEPVFRLDERFLLAEDALAALQQLARYHRRQFNIPVLAITGTNGKTTTKELISAALSSHYKAHFTKGNLNNHIGVPMTLLAMPPDTEIAVVEMGANHPGEIDFLCQIAEPTHGLITNLGKAHLQGFGSFEGVKRTKSELYRYLAAKNGRIFVNADEPHLKELAKENSKIIFYKRAEDLSAARDANEVRLVAQEPFIEIEFLARSKKRLSVQSRLIGLYNFQNLMTAVIVGRFFNVPPLKIKEAIEEYVPSNNRSQLLAVDSNTFVMDAYNANPTSMKNALASFAEMKGAPKVAIIGAMLELGEYAEEEHENIAQFALSLGFNEIIAVGKDFQKAARLHGIRFFENTAQLKSWYQTQSFSKTYFLLKGSRSIGLEKMLE